MMLLRALLFMVIAAVSAAMIPSAQAAQAEADALRAAMALVRSGDWDEATRVARTSGALGRDVVEWHRLRATKGTFDETRAFLERRPDWPGLPYLRQRSEGAVPLRGRAADVIAFFDEQPPRTGSGSVALAMAYREAGRIGDAEAQVVMAWLSQGLTAGEEAMLLDGYGGLLTRYHEARLDDRLWAGDRSGAERMVARVSAGWQALARARLALSADTPGVDGLIAAVPASLSDHPGLAYERFMWRIRKGRYDDAAALLLSRESAEDPLGRPGEWAGWRAVLARWAMRAGREDLAYRLASEHGLNEGDSYADLEWLAGFVALTDLNDPELALWHFERFRVAVDSPISLGRAGYWEGRAHEAMGNSEAAFQAYAFGGEHQTSFYGLLAAEKAGLDMDPALTGSGTVPDWRQARFLSSSVFEAAKLLNAAGEHGLAERFLTHLAESLNTTETAQLAEFALEAGEPHFAVMIAKRGVEYGSLVVKPYFPIVDLGVQDPRVPMELALSIARRESEFDAAAVSGVGARGLMQVMPGTAEEMAGDLDMGFDVGRLLTDPVYNATLGKAYLAELIETFGGNFVLVSAAYNAGPSRAFRWMDERGDPRSGRVDVVDWIEHIPFTETRNYVMRVMESLPVYRARLTGRVAPLRLSEELSAR